MTRRGRLAAVVLVLAAVLSGCTDGVLSAAGGPTSGSASRSLGASSTTAPSAAGRSQAAATTSAPGTATAPAGWPEEAANLRGGGTYWAVFLAVVPSTRAESLQPLYADAVGLHYNAAIGDVCASGADGHALPFDWSTAPSAVSIDFDTERAARQFVAKWKAAFGRDVAGVYNVQLACVG